MSNGTWSFTFTSHVKDVQTELATKVDKALEEVRIFDKKNPFWAEYFKDRKEV